MEISEVYRERNLVVLMAARLAQVLGYDVRMGRHNPSDPNDASHADPAGYAEFMNFVAIILPTGQVTWTLHDSEVARFSGIESDLLATWDGHDTAEKYRRLEKFAHDYEPVFCPVVKRKVSRLTAEWNDRHKEQFGITWTDIDVNILGGRRR